MVVKIVGEIGINHNGKLDTAKSLIDEAVKAGFDYVKFQKRDPDTCVPEEQKNIIRETPWGKISYIEYRKLLEFGLAEYDYIREYCKDKNIGWFASAWDIPSAKFLYEFGCQIIKIPSAKMTDETLLKYCRGHFDWIMMSTGMSTEEEIQQACCIACPDVIMHSISIYPTNIDDTRLKYITWLINHYECKEVGYSGHEQGVDLSIAAMACGATWIERHITLDKNSWGSDQKVSIEPAEMQYMARKIRVLEKALSEGYEPRKLLEGELVKREQLRGK